MGLLLASIYQFAQSIGYGLSYPVFGGVGQIGLTAVFGNAVEERPVVMDAADGLAEGFGVVAGTEDGIFTVGQQFADGDGVAGDDRFADR